eukprot:3419357-Pyramimonas_sp.AAC.1
MANRKLTFPKNSQDRARALFCLNIRVAKPRVVIRGLDTRCRNPYDTYGVRGIRARARDRARACTSSHLLQRIIGH